MARWSAAAHKGESVGHEDHHAVDALVGRHAFVELGDDAVTLVLRVRDPAAEQHVVDQEQPSRQQARDELLVVVGVAGLVRVEKT